VRGNPASLNNCSLHHTHLQVHTLLALYNADEFTRHHSALVYELVEAVLPVGTRLAKVNLACLKGQLGAVQGHALSITLHGDLQCSQSHVWPPTGHTQPRALLVPVHQEWMGGNKAGPLPFSSPYTLYICSYVEKHPRGTQELPYYSCAHTSCNSAMRTPQTNA